jgi:hypothetical protein
MKFLVERLNVGQLTAVGTAPRTPLPTIPPPDFAARVHAMAVRLGTHGPNEEAPDHSALLAMGAEVLPVLRDLFPGRLWFNRWEPHIQAPRGRSVSGLCRTLVAFGGAAAPYIGELLKSDEPETRYYATLVAGELPNRWLLLSSTTMRASPGARFMRWRPSMNRKAWRSSKSPSVLWRSRPATTNAHACWQCARWRSFATSNASSR